MAPSLLIDPSDDIVLPRATKQNGSPQQTQRTLLLSPPSLSSHPEILNSLLAAHDRSNTDIQMLDRLALGLVSLPESTYDLVLLLSDADGTRGESQSLLQREVLGRVVRSLKPGGAVKSQDGGFARSPGKERTEAVLAGLEVGEEGAVKPVQAAGTVKLSFGKKKERSNAAAVPANGVEAGNTGQTQGQGVKRAAPAGVGFDMGDGLEDEWDEMEIPSKEELLEGDMIDPDSLLTEEDRMKPVIIPEACKPNGKRRRACKDCSCGLKEKIEAEDAAKRAAADKGLQSLKLGADDLTEVDFTVQGKVGSCGNCALGDAFRCDGCPYIGMPAFKPGEEVRLLNNDVQL
ncbi:cytokine-induced anti-apoptosis inhibitor 1, Fe-S biogenesis-domain-containing protein [Elsinoe ampelina]|uniref:Cytokine-induced anti-apoptosis inhibitor 1, Fe-S biogenesis-domain-containing protein n=1 Tax=Elsinoe ampelina TaxID=302913 RepID=A0A6A6GDL8_9PEZI|nr:cytokine-induced anti-apoptosis inhibitor 1, Fe-S biogenesis-domain-containing protein [Elsinoe ampelina]